MVVFGRLNFARSPQDLPLASDLPCGASDDAGACVDDGDWRLQAESASAVTHTKRPMHRVMFCFMVRATSNGRAPTIADVNSLCILETMHSSAKETLYPATCSQSVRIGTF
jgi:hypothetical protein